MSCVDGSRIARLDLLVWRGGRVQSCVRPVAAVHMTAGLDGMHGYPKPPQLATNGVEDDAEGVSYWKIKHGIRLTGMPSWKESLTDQQIWTLALFLKHMDKLPFHVQQAWKQLKN
jgi:hypothetical protein